MGTRRAIKTSILLVLISLTIGSCRLPFKNLPGMQTVTPVEVVATNTPFLPPESSEQGLDPSPTSEQTAAPTFTDFPSPSPSPTATETLSSTTTPGPTNITLPTPTNLPTSTVVADVPTELPSDYPVYAEVERTRYLIAVSIDYEAHFVNASQDVYFTNRTGYPLESIVFAVNANLWQNTFALLHSSVNDTPATDVNLLGQWLTIGLAQPLEPGQTIKIGLAYTLALPYSSAKVENFGYTARQTNLIDWYPFIPPFNNGNWQLPNPYAFGENLVYEKADFFVDLSFANPTSSPVVAAPLPAASNNGVQHYEWLNARNFSLSISPYFLSSTAQAGDVTIVNYYFPEHALAAAQVLEMTRRSVEIFSGSFGPYPHYWLAVVETELNDGLESDGLYFLSSSFYSAYTSGIKNNLSVIAIHETSHQWWYGGVGSDQANEPWLDEALSTYSEYIFFENYDPSLLEWWWNFRVYSHQPFGYVDSTIYNFSTFPQYVNAIYFNGAEFLHLVRQRIGGPAFYQWMASYYAMYNGQIAQTSDLFTVLSQVSGVFIDDLKADYFLGY